MDLLLSRLCLGAVALGTCIILSCKPAEEEVQAPTLAPDILAKVGEGVITVQDLKEEVALREARQQPLPADLNILLEEMIEHEALVQRALQAGLDQSPEFKRLYDNLLIGRLRAKEINESTLVSSVSEEELRTQYQAEIERYSKPAKARLAILYRAAPSPGTPEQVAEVQGYLEAARNAHLQSPADPGRGPASIGFGALAIQNSEDQNSRYKGGDIGWLEPDRRGYRWPDAVLEVGFALPVGQPSEVISADGGFYIVLKTDERPGSVTPFEEVAPTLRHRLLANRRTALETTFREATLEGVPVETFPENLKDITLNTPADKPATESLPPSVPR